MSSVDGKLARWSPSMLRAVAWAIRARIAARKAVFTGDVQSPVRLPKAPAAPIDATRAVIAVLGRTRAKCLVRSLVLQQWYADHGEPIDVVIGVTPPSTGFRAHAWLDRPGEEGNEGFIELHRLRASRRRSSVSAPAADAASP